MAIRIDFEFETEYGIFRDALHLDNNDDYTQIEIDAMQQERVDNWIAIITAPPPPPLPEDTVVDSIPSDAVLVEDSPEEVI